MLAPVSPPKEKDKTDTINPTPNANLNKLTSLLPEHVSSTSVEM
jgi:hypothetical protein